MKTFAGQLGRFSIVGAMGFVVDTAVLYALVGLEGFSLLGGRLGSYLVAATTTWALNRAFTFKGGRRPAKGWDEIADLLEIEEANPFRVRAYRNAAHTVRGLGREQGGCVE